MEKSDVLVHCSVKNAVLCKNHRERVTQIWTSPSEEEEEEEERRTFWPFGFGTFATFWPFWFGTFTMLFSSTGCVVVVRHENTRRWTVGCYNGLQVNCFGDFEKFFCISIYCMSTLSLHIESTNSMIHRGVMELLFFHHLSSAWAYWRNYWNRACLWHDQVPEQLVW